MFGSPRCGMFVGLPPLNRFRLNAVLFVHREACSFAVPARAEGLVDEDRGSISGCLRLKSCCLRCAARVCCRRQLNDPYRCPTADAELNN